MRNLLLVGGIVGATAFAGCYGTASYSSRPARYDMSYRRQTNVYPDYQYGYGGGPAYVHTDGDRRAYGEHESRDRLQGPPPQYQAPARPPGPPPQFQGQARPADPDGQFQGPRGQGGDEHRDGDEHHDDDGHRR